MARAQGSVENTQIPDIVPNGYSFQTIPHGVIEIDSVVSGMVNRMPRAQVPPGSGRVVRNGRVRDDGTKRRPGTGLFGGTKPDSNQILGIVTFISEAGEVYLCRITSTSFHVLEPDLSGWIAYSILDEDGVATSFIGNTTHISVAQFFDKMYIADGVNPIWEVDFSGSKVQSIGGSPKAKYIATFADRVVAGNVGLKIGGFRPATIAWPVNSNPRKWDGPSSGQEDLGSTQIGNQIAGMFPYGDQLVIIRERSIWHASRQPFALAPFSFREIVGGMGCDLPYTTVGTPFGIMYADQRTREVYLYTPGSRPQPLAGAVNRDVLTDLEDLQYAQATFDPFENEYHLGIIPSGQTLITRTWVFNLEKKAWSYDDSPTVSALGVVLVPGTSVTIDSLVGTIDEQNPAPLGRIDDYGEPAKLKPTLFKGTSTGEVLEQDYDSDHDWDGVQFNFEFSSPDIGHISRIRTLVEVSVEVDPGEGGSVTIAHSKDELTWVSKTLAIASTDDRVRLPKQLTGGNIFWRVLSDSPGFKIKTWWARILEKHLNYGRPL